jgi:phage terminase small subunit
MTDADLSPLMSKLTEQQRRFVLALLMQAIPNFAQAARDAGYSDAFDGAKVRAFELMHNPRILAALKEEMSKRIALGAIVGIYGLQAIASDPDHKDHLKACVALADRGGYSPIVQQEIRVEHTIKSPMERIKELAPKFGEEGRVLLEKAGLRDVPRETTQIELKVEASDG